MIIIFDLDDTLYREINYVKSGFRKVSKFLSYKLAINEKEINFEMLRILDKMGRGQVFDYFLEKKNIRNVSLVKKCLQIYRNHKPKIKLDNEAIKVISRLKKTAYMVTDGNKIVQRKKIKALNIDNKFKKIFITHNYGIKKSKPSVYCFKKIKDLENCQWNKMMYVGDNPFKDFVNLNTLGVNTVRLMKGPNSRIKINKKYDAKYKISNLLQIFNLIR
jgi:putative hydrolase of the HAD superfamily|tara:strand:- start:1175 stop:1828 length:654 start_codon:yes stop_codon:yes gene_type:complete